MRHDVLICTDDQLITSFNKRTPNKPRLLDHKLNKPVVVEVIRLEVKLLIRRTSPGEDFGRRDAAEQLTARLAARTDAFSQVYMPGAGDFFDRNSLLYRDVDGDDSFSTGRAGRGDTKDRE